jgi:hypothetical protein
MSTLRERFEKRFKMQITTSNVYYYIVWLESILLQANKVIKVIYGLFVVEIIAITLLTFLHR